MKGWPAIAIAIALPVITPAAQAFADRHVFQIPASDAEDAIGIFGIQAHKQIVAPGDALLGLKTPEVRGEFAVSEALSILLKGTGLVVVSDDGRVVVLAKPGGSTQSHAKPQQPEAPAAAVPEVVTITGYRASLVAAAAAKREAIGVTDAVFAEDIAKFPDSNLAVSLNRMPGMLLTRDANGEGTWIAIRGLSTDFSKILLDNAPISVATAGIIDNSGSNRQVDLSVFPSELFSSLEVEKTSKAQNIEGGAAGTVNLRMPRPLDHPGFSASYVLQGVDNSQTNGPGVNGAAIVSNNWDTGTSLGTIGVLIGLAARHTYTYTTGWEDGNAGWVTPSIMTSSLCGASSGCDLPGSTVSIGGNSITIATKVPTNVTIPGFAVGSTINAAALKTLNPGLNMTQISNMLLPRLPRTMYERGTHDRYNAIASFEMRPTETFDLTLDTVFGRTMNDVDRSDMGWGVRAGDGAQPMIPMNVTLDANGVVTSGQFANAQFALEARQYKEASDFFFISPGAHWQVDTDFSLSAQAYMSRSHFLQEAPNIFLPTCPSSGTPTGIPGCTAPVGGVTVDFLNKTGHPTVSTNIDLNDPANFQWYNGRALIRNDKRYTATNGVRLDATFGGEVFTVKAGVAHDTTYRSIVGMDASYSWEVTACGNNPLCSGKDDAKIPQAKLANYLYRGPAGFVALDYNAFKADSGYYEINGQALAQVMGRCVKQKSGNFFSVGTMTGAASGCFEEKTTGLYGEAEGSLEIAGESLRYNAGLRWVETKQAITSPVLRTNGDYDFATARHTYQVLLPSLSTAYKISDNLIFRTALSRTITRPDISKMVFAVNFGDITAQTVLLGNPGLKPYFSNNIDAGIEYYWGSDGFFSVAGFEKRISGFTVPQIVSQPFSYLNQFGINWSTLTYMQRKALFDRSGCTSDADCSSIVGVEQQVNAPGIETIRGLELSFVTPLDVLLEYAWLKGFGLNSNLTLIDQSSSGSAAVHATGVAPFTYNLTGYYERNGLAARLSYSFIDRTYGTSSNQQSVCLPTLAAASKGCPQGAYLMSAPYGQADFSASVRLAALAAALPSETEMTFGIQNIFDARQRSYFQYENAAHNDYATGRTFLVGLHGTY